MSSGKNLYIEFNNHAKTFLNLLLTKLKEEKLPIKMDPTNKVQSYLTSFIFCETLNIESPVKIFLDHVEVYGLHIMTKNEIFFKQDHFVSNVESFSGELGLVDCWDSLSDNTKDIIWRYMQILYVTGMGALDKRNDLQLILDKIKQTK